MFSGMRLLLGILPTVILIQASTVRPRTTIPMTTIPTTVPFNSENCIYKGVHYHNGQTIYKDRCSETICQDGQLIVGDDKCMFITPECNGVLKYVSTQCCPLCLNVSSPMPPTTTPPMKPSTTSQGTWTVTTRTPPDVADKNNKTISDNGSIGRHGTYLTVLFPPLLSTLWFQF